jgi:hypothetical protein
MKMPLLLLLPLMIAMACLIGAKIYHSNRAGDLHSNDSLQEAFLWIGGFGIYAVLDYFILMH